MEILLTPIAIILFCLIASAVVYLLGLAVFLVLMLLDAVLIVVSALYGAIFGSHL